MDAGLRHPSTRTKTLDTNSQFFSIATIIRNHIGHSSTLTSYLHNTHPITFHLHFRGSSKSSIAQVIQFHRRPHHNEPSIPSQEMAAASSDRSPKDTTSHLTSIKNQANLSNFLITMKRPMLQTHFETTYAPI